MARSLSGFSVTSTLKATLQNSLDGSAFNATAALGATLNPDTALTTGTAEDKADRIWQDTARELSSGASEDLDLYDFGSIDIGAGAGRDATGQLITLAEVVALQIYNRPTSTGSLVIGGKGTAAAWNSPFNGDDDAVLILPPGGFWLLFNPADPAYVVTDATNHLLQMAASGGDLTYDIYILGRSA